MWSCPTRVLPGFEVCESETKEMLVMRDGRDRRYFRHMVKKNATAQSAQKQSAREKAAQLRAEQERSDRRIRTIVIATVAAIVALVVAVVAYVISQQLQAQQEAANVDPAAVLGVYADGRPIVVSASGIGQADPAVPTLTEYFDYSCGGCAQAELLFGKQVAQDVKDGKYNVAYQPVSGHAPYQLPAVSASLIVAQKSPEQWHDFHHALMRFFVEQTKTGDNRIIADLNQSAMQVRELAASVGVPDEIIATFPSNVAEDYLRQAGEAWNKTVVEGRNGFFTPELVAQGSRKIELDGFDPNTVIPQIRAALGVE
ncbi:thioredoxin [Schaalia canis]|uniref:Thioredoxin n=2 Tax=Schaalia canis TaxID=100469 RepID=A0A3P1SFH0_9ACTO|nr:thioredoxin [Schaalia canis]